MHPREHYSQEGSIPVHIMDNSMEKPFIPRIATDHRNVVLGRPTSKRELMEMMREERENAN